jgi:osmotically inducible protein OsmC
LQTDARGTLRFINDAPTITRIDLYTTGVAGGLDEARFQRFAEEAKEGCPISRAMAIVSEITVTARLA